ncbi:uncharacterized protein [Clytia hemisphaerica]|uniref:Cnidarian restricted protein n=1 Tax=Clytia hemisphaerica TaxID=252671 RepID=A0A7M5VDJ5_9CNID
MAATMRSLVFFALVLSTPCFFGQSYNGVSCGRLLPTHNQKDAIKDSNFTMKWSLIPMANENVDWITVYYQANENQQIKSIWQDIGGITAFGKEKFNDTLFMNVQKNAQVEVTIQNIQESMILYLTAVFINKKGEIQGGPLYSKVKISTAADESIKRDNIIKTFGTYYPKYEVSFDIKPFGTKPTDWRNVLYVTVGGKLSKYGDQIPAVWFEPGHFKIRVCSSIDGSYDHCYTSAADLPKNKYTHINIKQEENTQGIYFYTIKIDGDEKYRIQNNQPRTFRDVKVYKSNPWYPAANAYIKNLKVITTKN